MFSKGSEKTGKIFGINRPSEIAAAENLKVGGWLAEGFNEGLRQRHKSMRSAAKSKKVRIRKKHQKRLTWLTWRD